MRTFKVSIVKESDDMPFARDNQTLSSGKPMFKSYEATARGGSLGAAFSIVASLYPKFRQGWVFSPIGPGAASIHKCQIRECP